MAGFVQLLRRNRNYRYTWTGQIVSEIGDNFNNIAVFGLAMAKTGSGMVVTGVMLSRAIPMMMAGPLAGVLLDRMDRKRIMIVSDLFRAVIAIGFVLTVVRPETWWLFVLSGLLMFASPFFTSGRASILPTIASKDELHTANSLTQATQWTSVTIGSFLGGTMVMQFGYEVAFLFNALSFVISALCISQLRVAEGGFRPQRNDLGEDKIMQPWREYKQGLSYIRCSPLILGIGLISVGWATGGGAAQILFSLFGEGVFHRGASGIGIIWGCAGIGLIAGGIIGHLLGKRLSFGGYKVAVSVCYLIHGGSYVMFSQMKYFGAALFFIGLSRAAVAVSSVLNFSELLRHVSDSYRGRVFATIETFTWSVMMLSMTAAGAASQRYSPRAIGAVAGILSSMTAVFWGWANWTGRLPEPALSGVNPEDVEVHGEPVA